MEQKDYLQKKQFFINYCNTLLRKKHILRKKELLEIRNRLLTKGFISFKYHYLLLNSYLKKDNNLNYINITNDLRSLQEFKELEKSTTYTLPINRVRETRWEDSF